MHPNPKQATEVIEEINKPTVWDAATTYDNPWSYKGSEPVADYIEKNGGVTPESKRAFLKQAAPSQNKIDNLKKIYKLDDNQINQVIQTDPSKNQTDYVSWIAKQLSEGKIRLPEDTEKIKNQLSIFDKLKRSPKFNGNKDIQGYTPASLYDTVNEHKEETSRKEQTRELKSEGKPGAKIIYNQNGIVVYEVTDTKALMELSSNTNWCTAHERFSVAYLESGPNYVIYKDNKPYAQYDPNTDQLLDVKDENFPKGLGLNITDPVIVQVVKALPEVFKDVLIEPLNKETALKSPKWAFYYAKNIIKGRFPEGEKVIATNAEYSYYYARDVLKHRFPEGEAAIATNADYASNYERRFAKEIAEGDPFPAKVTPESKRAFLKQAFSLDVNNLLNNPEEKYFGLIDPDGGIHLPKNRDEHEDIAVRLGLGSVSRAAKLGWLRYVITTQNYLNLAFSTQGSNNALNVLRTVGNVFEGAVLDYYSKNGASIEYFQGNIKDAIKWLKEMNENPKTAEIKVHDTPQLKPPRQELRSRLDDDVKEEIDDNKDFMKFSTITPESKRAFLKQAVPSQNKIDNLKKIYKLDDTQINQVIQTDPTKNQTDYVSWIAKQLFEGKIRLPEDTEKIKGQLSTFDKLKRSPKFNGNKDIQGYTPELLNGTVSQNQELSKKEQTRELKSEGKPGAKIIYNQDNIVVYEVTDVTALMELSSNTNWCTAHGSFSISYLGSGSNYVIYKDGKPYAQYDPNSDQLRDVKDQPFPKGEFLNILDPVIVQVVKALPEVFKDVLAEPLDKEKALTSLRLALYYARYVLHDRFPEGEELIATNVKASYYYAKNIIKGRFPEGEKVIATDPEVSYDYAKNVIKARFPEGEKVIATDPEVSYTYARDVLKHRFPEGEKIMSTAKDAFYSYAYAVDILKHRFPEGEKIIASDPELSSKYTERFAKEIAEGPPFPAKVTPESKLAFLKRAYTEDKGLISPNGQINTLKGKERSHEQIAKRLGLGTLDEAFSRGWVRYSIVNTSLSLQMDLNNQKAVWNTIEFLGTHNDFKEVWIDSSKSKLSTAFRGSAEEAKKWLLGENKVAKVTPESKRAFLKLSVPSQNKIDNLKKIYKLDDNQINQVIQTDPTKNQTDYVSWIAKQLFEGKIRLPEDTEKIKNQLSIFDKLKRSPKFNGNKDIQGYTPASLYDTVNEHKEETSKKEQVRELKTEGKPGAKIIYNQNGIVVYEVTDVVALMGLSSNTNWCTAHENYATKYLKDGPNYVIYKDEEPYAQYDPNSDQLLDTKDQPFPKGLGLNITDPVIVQVVKALPEVFKDVLIEPLDKEKALKSSPKWAFYYARDIIKGRFPEGEAIIGSDMNYAYTYARDILHGRFPEGEKAIATNAGYSYHYAIGILKARFPEGEKAIAKDAEYSYDYAKYIIKGRFPEGEKAIATNDKTSYDYAMHVIKARFPEGEKAIATNAEYSYYYTRDVLKHRFPEGEAAIATDADYAYSYKRRFAKEIAEGPPFPAKITPESKRAFLKQSTVDTKEKKAFQKRAKVDISQLLQIDDKNNLVTKERALISPNGTVVPGELNERHHGDIARRVGFSGIHSAVEAGWIRLTLITSRKILGLEFISNGPNDSNIGNALDLLKELGPLFPKIYIDFKYKGDNQNFFDEADNDPKKAYIWLKNLVTQSNITPKSKKAFLQNRHAHAKLAAVKKFKWIYHPRLGAVIKDVTGTNITHADLYEKAMKNERREIPYDDVEKGTALVSNGKVVLDWEIGRGNSSDAFMFEKIEKAFKNLKDTTKIVWKGMEKPVESTEDLAFTK